MIDEGYAKLKPIFQEMEKAAAEVSLFSYDDTRLKILSVIKHNKENPDKKRTGQFTSVIIAETASGMITLFYSSVKHAGENMQALINKRSQSADKFITMSDALGANTITHDNVIEANCLAHAIVSTPRSAYKLEGESPSPEACLKYWVPSLELMEVTT